MASQFPEYTQNSIICVDSYEDGVLKGRFYCPRQGGESFASLSQFLLKMEAMLDEGELPQSYTQLRSFGSIHPLEESAPPTGATRQGAAATFELQILFRRHTSWQGLLRRTGEPAQYSFRSVLELITLMDSALRSRDRFRYA